MRSRAKVIHYTVCSALIVAACADDSSMSPVPLGTTMEPALGSTGSGTTNEPGDDSADSTSAPEVYGPCELPWTQDWEVSVVAEEAQGPQSALAVGASGVGVVHRGAEDTESTFYSGLVGGAWSAEEVTSSLATAPALVFSAAGQPRVGLIVEGFLSEKTVVLFSRGAGWVEAPAGRVRRTG